MVYGEAIEGKARFSMVGCGYEIGKNYWNSRAAASIQNVEILDFEAR